MVGTTEKTVVAREWSNLPQELLSLIASHLHSASIDILRFRATCTSWRSAIPLPPPAHTLFEPRFSIRWFNITFIQTSTIYRLQYKPSSTSSSKKGWLIMVENSTSNPVQLLDPFTNKPLSETGTHPYDCTTPLKYLNLSNFRFVELFTPTSLLQFHQDELRCPTYTHSDLVKAILFPSLTCQTTFDESSSRMVFALYSRGTLSVSRIDEDEDWIALQYGGDNDSGFNDVIFCNGQLYAVDKYGTIFWINCSTLKLVQFSPILCQFRSNKEKRLVECNGSLYVVDIEYTYVRSGFYLEQNFTDMKVYKLDVDHGWLHVEKLDNVAFVLGKTCSFSLTVEDYHGCEANCIYLHYQQRVRAFSLETCEFKDPKIFWPCPSLFESRFNL